MIGVYRQLLRLYPAAHRDQFGNEMLAIFSDLEAERASKHLLSRTLFSFREVMGLIRGACLERAHALLGPDIEFPFSARSFVMRNGFRFPKSTVVFMILILGGVLMAIKRGGDIERSLSQVTPQIVPVQHSWNLVPPVVLLWAFFCALGLVGWGIVFALKRSGMHRMAEISGDRK